MAILGIRDNPNDLCHRSVLCLASLATSPTERASLEEGKGKGASLRRDGYEHIYFARANGLRRGFYTKLADFAAEISSITANMANMANKTNDSNKSNGNNLLIAVNLIPLNNTRLSVPISPSLQDQFPQRFPHKLHRVAARVNQLHLSIIDALASKSNRPQAVWFEFLG